MDMHAHCRRSPKGRRTSGDASARSSLEALAVHTQGRGPSAINGGKVTLLATPLSSPFSLTAANEIDSLGGTQRRAWLRARPALPHDASASRGCGGPRERDCPRELCESLPSLRAPLSPPREKPPEASVPEAASRTAPPRQLPHSCAVVGATSVDASLAGGGRAAGSTCDDPQEDPP
jgi:hypothetical protein